MCALCRSVCHDPELRIHSDQDSRRHSFPSGVLAVGAEGGPDLSVALGCVCKGDVTVAWPPGLCSQLSVEAELQLLPWFVLADLCSPLPGAAHKLVCYFASWAQSRPGPASVLPHDLDPFLCTHLIFAFATMENNQIVAMTSQKGKIVYPEFNKLKERCVHTACGDRIFRFYRQKKINPISLVTHQLSSDSSGPNLLSRSLGSIPA